MKMVNLGFIADFRDVSERNLPAKIGSWRVIPSMQTEPETVTFGFGITPESSDRVDLLVHPLSAQLGARVSREQLFNVAVREAIRRREGEKP